MKFKTLASIGLALAVAGGLTVATTGEADAKKVRWKMQSTFGSNLPHLGTSGVRFSKNVEEMTDGDLEIKFFEPGALVPALELFDAVSAGSVDAGWSSPGYWAGKEPSMPLFTTVPFGPNMSEYLAWLYGAGGPNASFALLTDHYMRSYGATREDFGRIAIAQRSNALANPQALELRVKAALERQGVRGGEERRIRLVHAQLVAHRHHVDTNRECLELCRALARLVGQDGEPVAGVAQGVERRQRIRV